MTFSCYFLSPPRPPYLQVPENFIGSFLLFFFSSYSTGRLLSVDVSSFHQPRLTESGLFSWIVLRGDIGVYDLISFCYKCNGVLLACLRVSFLW